MIAILSDDRKQDIGARIHEYIKSKGLEVEYISTSGLNIKPCYSCGGCSTKTYGKCILKDDMDAILRKVIHADKVIFVTPVLWGSYSTDTKKVFDRMAIIGDTHYYYRKGQIVKGSRSNMKQLIAVGVKDNCMEEEKDTFHKLVYENTHIMNIAGKSFVVGQQCDAESIAEEVCK